MILRVSVKPDVNLKPQQGLDKEANHSMSRFCLLSVIYLQQSSTYGDYLKTKKENVTICFGFKNNTFECWLVLNNNKRKHADPVIGCANRRHPSIFCCSRAKPKQNEAFASIITWNNVIGSLIVQHRNDWLKNFGNRGNTSDDVLLFND